MIARCFLIIMGLGLFGCQAGASAPDTPKPETPQSDSSQPNILFILSDDQGIGDLGVYGSTDILTPNLDELASEGIRFTQFYAAGAVCSPSRAGIMTGRYPERVGVPANSTTLKGSNKGLPLREITLPEQLRQEGYRTALIGKWHLGYDEHLWPNNQGFDHSFGFLGGVIDNYSHFMYWRGPNRHDLYENGVETFADGTYFPDLMVDEALDFIDKTKDQPFFMFFALGSPHYPYQGEEKWLRYYREQGVPYPRDLYGAFVTTMDDRIGHLLDGLEARGLKEDTIVIFQSDHGHSTEERAHFGGGSAGGLRGAKRSLFEGGVRVPAMISWPGVLEPGERGQMLSALDWYPTLLNLIDGSAPLALDGLSMKPVLEDAESAEIRQRLHWEFLKQWSVRDGDWKLLHNVMDTTHVNNPPPMPEEDMLFLVNLRDDPAESENLARQFPERVDALLDLHEQMRVKDPVRDFERDAPVLESKP